MKEIPLTQGYAAIVDDADYEWLCRLQWRIQKIHQFRYARTTFRKMDGTQDTQMMHRIILGLTNPTIKVDHINGNGLDNRRENLRFASVAQNSQNRKMPRNNTSGFKGVTKRSGARFCAAIRADGQYIHGGYYNTALEAASAYNELALQYHGEFACLNSITAE